MDYLIQNHDSVNNFCILKIIRSVDNYLAKNLTSCLSGYVQMGTAKTTPRQSPPNIRRTTILIDAIFCVLAFLHLLSRCAPRLTSMSLIRQYGAVFWHLTCTALSSRAEQSCYLRDAGIRERWGQNALICPFLFLKKSKFLRHDARSEEKRASTLVSSVASH